MADGSIRIDTEIQTKQAQKELKGLEGSMTKTAEKIASLRSKMDALKDAKVPTKEYTDLQKQIESTEKKLLTLYDRQERFLETGGKESSSAYKKMVYDAEQLEKKLQYAEQAMQNLTDSGKAFTIGSETDKYAKMSDEVKQLSQKMESDTQRQTELQSAIVSEEERLAQIKANATVSDQYIIDALERRQQLLAQIKDMEAAGMGTGYQEYDSATVELQQVESEIKKYKSSLSEVPEKFSRMREAAQKAFNAIRSGLSAVGNIGKKAFSGLASMAKKAFSAIGSISKKSGGLLSTFASRLKGLALSLLIFNWISKGFNAMISGMKAGFSNFAGYSSSFANAVQNIKNSMSTLGNQFAAAFAPIVQSVIPWLVSLINMLTRAAAAFAQFIAALTGKSTFTRAKKQQDAYNKSLGGTAAAAKKAAGALAEFDDLDVLNKDSGGGGGGGGGAGGADFGDMFEEAEISSEVQEFVDKLKEAWENADFTEIGGIIGEKIRDALNSIPWDTIQETVNKVAKSLATLLNGIVETDGLGDTIGKTIAQAINTGIGAVATFSENLHWDSIGKFIADSINGVLKNINWETALTAASTLGTGIATMLNNALTEEVFQNIGTTIGNGINTALAFAISFMEEFDFKQFGSNIGTGIKNAIATIDWSLLGETVGTAVQSIFDLFIGFVESNPLEGIGEKIGTAINNAIAAIDLESFASALSTFVIGLLNELSIAIQTTDWSQVARDIVDALKAIDWMGIASGLFDVGKSLIDGLLEAFGELPAPIQIATTAILGFLAAFKISSAITGLIATIKGLVSILAGAGGLSGAISAIVAALGGPLTIAIGAVIAVGALLIANWDKIKEVAGNLKDWLFEKWEQLKEFIPQKTKEIVDSVAKWFSELPEKIGYAIGFVIGKLQKWGEEVHSFFKTKVPEIINNVVNWFKELPGKIYDAIIKIKEKITEWKDNAIEFFRTSVPLIVEKVIKFFEELPKKIVNVGKKTIEGLNKGIENAKNWILGKVSSFVNGFIKGFKDALGIHSPSTIFSDIGKNIVQGLINGIQSLASGAVNVLKGIGNSMLNGFKSLFGIHSPSKEMDENGEYLMKGLENGIAGDLDRVLDQFEILGASVQEILAPMQESVLQIFSEMTSGIVEDLSNLTEQANYSVECLASEIIEKIQNVCESISGNMQTTSENWSSSWGLMVEHTKSACQEIIDAIATMNESIQSMCSSILAAIESVKAASSSISSGSGLRSFGMNSVSYSSIPQLASGAVIRGGNPFMAILGDQPAGQVNIEAPLATIEQAVENVMNRNGGYRGGNIGNISADMIMDGETVGRILTPYVLNELGRRGYNVNILGVT